MEGWDRPSDGNTDRHIPLPNNYFQTTSFSTFHRYNRFLVCSTMLEYRTSGMFGLACLLGDIPTIHLVTEAVAPFLLMASLLHGALQVTNKCIPEQQVLTLFKQQLLCQAHEIRASYSRKEAAKFQPEINKPGKALARDVGPTAQAQRGATSPGVPISTQDPHAGVGSAVLVQG